MDTKKEVERITKNQSLTLAAGDLRKAESRLHRLSRRVAEIEGSHAELGVELAQAEAELGGEVSADQAATITGRIKELSQQLTATQQVAEGIRGRAVPKAEAELKQARERLDQALGVQLTLSRRLLEDQAAQVFDALMAGFAEWDKVSAELIEKHGAQSLYASHLGGTGRFSLSITSEAMAAFAARCFQANIDVAAFKEQLKARNQIMPEAA